MDVCVKFECGLNIMKKITNKEKVKSYNFDTNLEFIIWHEENQHLFSITINS